MTASKVARSNGLIEAIDAGNMSYKALRLGSVCYNIGVSKMKKIHLAVIVAVTMAAAPVTAGNMAAPVMEPSVIVADTTGSSANQAEIVTLTLTALVFLTAIISAN
ncbi:hypothetical protein SAMN04488077_10774 [Roseovarius tolerans]|uniref:Uncharacterized protein n=2 Tax=Roseovarius tolerans TaxID=74031 RepID=A0A1H8AKB2_9RHOB|nr:hypothetical protein SAMN04488077_10774 [Roseovarius tolerans]